MVCELCLNKRLVKDKAMKVYVSLWIVLTFNMSDQRMVLTRQTFVGDPGELG